MPVESAREMLIAVGNFPVLTDPIVVDDLVANRQISPGGSYRLLSIELDAVKLNGCRQIGSKV
ncbi:hypothetical protein HGP16_06840 [Rhizobium sp. P40RR-XXII]|uniref:hypothetical protein n=1 Tax=Rhizobium sp. P28RR-XV TaxID=2726737 RepID=UPI001456C616|nr:hypothetical protein [Rhizobium sp. P28RR-XV]NLR84819.1 hypothetical protein [Rhizobium sp. P28RR-XV]NLS16274.1 hypothetical protein [Rhizobium sp. P40RR-XXII]